ncbi:MAG: electron transfer flavoprotein subunit alpha/FixB family protein [Candidatus Eremiobacteraeota bacterium]|nr:electron transfer flavoprotein subunit alpha/FixB family protein [Candidatus Eremiobacteraeota bacterium]
MSQRLWTIVFTKDDKISRESLEVISAAKQMGKDIDLTIEAIFAGHKISVEDYRELLHQGIDRVYIIDHKDFRDFNLGAMKELISEMAEKYSPSIILMPANVYGKELAPSLSGMLKTGLLADCIEIRHRDGFLECTRPIYAGRILSKVKLDCDGVKIASIRPHVYPVPETVDEVTTEVEIVQYNGFSGAGAVIREIQETLGGMDISEANIIVSGGKGMKSAENFALLEDLARLLGGAVGASRSAVDEGWRPHHDQVGQTGKVVMPDLYIACGISGAVQHLVGMNRSKCIVAINKDPDAPIMKIADYAIVGDLFEMIPILTEKFRKCRTGG